jgi:hypothetical protein
LSAARKKLKQPALHEGNENALRDAAQTEETRLTTLTSFRARNERVRNLKKKVTLAAAQAESAGQPTKAFNVESSVASTEQATPKSGPEAVSLIMDNPKQHTKSNIREVKPGPKSDASEGPSIAVAAQAPVHDNDAEARRQQEMQGWKSFFDGSKGVPPVEPAKSDRKETKPGRREFHVIKPGRKMILQLTPNQCTCPVPVQDKDVESQRQRPVQRRKWFFESSKDAIEHDNGATKEQDTVQKVTFRTVGEHITWKKDNIDKMSPDVQGETPAGGEDSSAAVELEPWELVTIS